LNKSKLSKEIKCDKIEGLEHLDKVISIDQSPIGRTPRSNPATYTGLFSYIRDLLSQTIEAKSRGYKPGRFSFNVKGGRCEACQGDGMTKVEMHFLADVYVMCDVCNGDRYNEQTVRGKI
jgi:excinuclease ABC subunit A